MSAHPPTRQPRTYPAAMFVAVAAAATLSACSGAAEASSAGPAAQSAPVVNTSPDQKRVTATKDEKAAALLPAAIRERGSIIAGNAGAGGGTPPLVFTADDDKTVIGVEVDLAHLFADKLGLKVETPATSWENVFLGIDSGRYDVALSNVTVTEERKEKYDFASYRVDSLAYEAKAGSDIVVNGPADIAGLKVAVGSGTNQEQILLAWDGENQAAGLEPAEITYYQNEADFLLALESGRIDLYFGPAPSASYRHQTTGKTEIVGVVPGGGDIPAQIAAMSLKDSGLAAPIAAALNHLIESGDYADVLAKWGLDVEAIDVSEVNPPGLPAS